MPHSISSAQLQDFSTLGKDSSAPITIALDAMGGDFGVEAAIPGAALVNESAPYVRYLIFGDQKQIEPLMGAYPSLAAVSEVIHTDKVVANGEKPSAALRQSKGSSMRMAIEAVQKGDAQAIVSSGNTGALMAMAKIVLKTLPGVHRPAIASILPSAKGDTVMLDLGANVLVDAENLAQFAVLGAVFAKAHKGLKMPSVGLLNVGSEETKGPDHVRGGAKILKNVDFMGRYYGFIEGDDIVKGTVDVVVCDGYAGNIALKTVEGMGRWTTRLFKESITTDPLAKIGSLFCIFALRRLKRKLDPRLYNGGVFLGLNGLCIKSHGGSDEVGFSSAVLRAVELAHHDYVHQVGDEINNLMSQVSALGDGMGEL